MGITFSSPACRKAAALLEAAAEESLDPDLFRLCARCLYEAAEFAPSYIHGVSVCFPFLTEAAENIKNMCKMTQNDVELHDFVFELVECFAVIAREHVRNKGTQHILPAQVEVMRHFEDCGEWTPEDGTLITHYYYKLLPDAAMPGNVAAPPAPA